MFKINESNIGIAGDWHGDKAWAKIALYTLSDYGISTVLHVGDFGFWHGNSGKKYLQYVSRVLTSRRMTLIVTLGNHEDYIQIRRMQTHPENNQFVYDKDFPNILVAKRGARWIWENTSFVSLGGANSIDRDYRTKGIDWWVEEQITAQDIKNTIAGGKSEVMISHDCPIGVDILGSHRSSSNGWSYEEIEYANKSRIALRKAVNVVKPKMIFHGHYHKSLDLATTLNDGHDDFQVRTIGMDMNSSIHGNIGVYNLSTQLFERVSVEAEYVREFYRKRKLKSE